MLTIPHAISGLAIALAIPHPAIGLPVALLSHFAFDFLLPHWNPHLYSEKKNHNRLSKPTIYLIIIDGIGAGAISLLLSIYNSQGQWSIFIYLMLASFMAILPDFIKIPYYFFNYKPSWLKQYIQFEHKYQSRSGKLWGILSQVAVFIFCLLFFFSN